MISTSGKGHFGYFHMVQGSGRQAEVFAFHAGLVSSAVVGAILMVRVHPNEDPMDQIRKTENAAEELK